VDDGLHIVLSQELLYQVMIADIALGHREAGTGLLSSGLDLLDIAALYCYIVIGIEVVYPHYRSPSTQQSLRCVGADEASSAGHQDWVKDHWVTSVVYQIPCGNTIFDEYIDREI